MLLDETPDIYTFWLERCTASKIVGARVFDVRLAVIAEKYDVDKLMTFNDSDFTSLANVGILTPSHPAVET